MPRVEVSLPEELYAEFEQLVEEEFVNRDEAVEELLSAGMNAYRPEIEETDPESEFAQEYAEDMWDSTEDPAADDDEYSF